MMRQEISSWAKQTKKPEGERGQKDQSSCVREGKKEGSSQSIQKGKGVTVTVLVEREKLRSEANWYDSLWGERAKLRRPYGRGVKERGDGDGSSNSAVLYPE